MVLMPYVNSGEGREKHLFLDLPSSGYEREKQKHKKRAERERERESKGQDKEPMDKYKESLVGVWVYLQLLAED